MDIDLIRKHKQFQNETKLILLLLWEKNMYNEFESKIINNKIVQDYFEKQEVKELLTPILNTSFNKFGVDVRSVAFQMIEQYKKEMNIQTEI